MLLQTFSTLAHSLAFMLALQLTPSNKSTGQLTPTSCYFAQKNLKTLVLERIHLIMDEASLKGCL